MRTGFTNAKALLPIDEKLGVRTRLDLTSRARERAWVQDGRKLASRET